MGSRHGTFRSPERDAAVTCLRRANYVQKAVS